MSKIFDCLLELKNMFFFFLFFFKELNINIWLMNAMYLLSQSSSDKHHFEYCAFNNYFANVKEISEFNFYVPVGEWVAYKIKMGTL